MEETVYTPFEFFNLPDYLQRKIMIEELDFESINNLCEAASRSKSEQAILFNQLCADSEVWRSKFLYTFPSYFERMDRDAANFWKDSYKSFGKKAKKYEEDFFNYSGRYNSPARVESLLRLGVDPNVELVYKRGAREAESGGWPTRALELAVMYGNTEVVRLLLQAGAEVNYQFDRPHANGYLLGATPLIASIPWKDRKGRPRRYILSDIDDVKLLLEAGADVNLPAKNGYTALMMASRFGHTEIVRVLLEAGADPNLQILPGLPSSGLTALTIATIGFGLETSHEHIEIVKVLLEYGADPNLQDKNGYTALLIALSDFKRGADNLPTIFEIIKYKPDPDIRNNNGETAIELAEELGLDSVVDALMYLKREKRV